jgi:hypothetical protein
LGNFTRVELPEGVEQLGDGRALEAGAQAGFEQHARLQGSPPI